MQIAGFYAALTAFVDVTQFPVRLWRFAFSVKQLIDFLTQFEQLRGVKFVRGLLTQPLKFATKARIHN